MSLNGPVLYRFGGLTFNVDENILRKGDKPLALTPKMLELLGVLVKNQGRLLKKDDLMSKVWAGSFVEESNLTVTIRQLRKVLEDDAHHPIFIETVARRGYRFIADVETVGVESGLAVETKTAGPEENRGSGAGRSFVPIAAAVLMIGLLSAGAWYFYNQRRGSSFPVLVQPFFSEKLSSSGKIVHAVISADGRIVTYTSGIDGKQSVWLRQMDAANNIEIIPPSDDVYGGLALSPDGNFLYFTRRPRNFVGQADMYRVSIFGGIPARVVSDVQGWINVSHDGIKVSYVRCYYRDTEFCSLWLADAADGKNERMIASRPRPFRIADNEISPDGHSIAFAVGQSENAANEFALMEVDIETGIEHEITSEKFFNIKSLTWLPDSNELLFTASRIPNKNFRIWRVSSQSGEIEPLTNDAETYGALSLNADASRLVSTRIEDEFRLYLSSMVDPSAKRVVANAMYASFAPGGKIFFSSTMSGNDEIWSINADGSEQRQLTNDTADDLLPIVSPDRNAIFFASNRTGQVQVWQMNPDGSGQRQITQKEGGMPLFVSPDGKWVYYHHGLQRTLWRIAITGGEEQKILDRSRPLFAFSPDGTQVAYPDKDQNGTNIAICSLTDGSLIKSIPAADLEHRLSKIAWLPDGQTIAYALADNEFENNTLWLQPIDNGKPQKLADLGNEEVSSLNFAPDGKTFAIVQGGWKHDAVLLKGLR